MTTYLPDTNILINALNGRPGHRKLLRTLITKGDRPAGCSATVSELFSGVHLKDLATMYSLFDFEGVARTLGQ